MSNVTKSYEITDARIQFVSLVDKAANKKTFLLTKAENGNAGFQTNGRILKVDEESHYVTGVVYEPNVADAHDNYMTEAEIEKAAHWFMKNGDKIDIQHSFEEADGLTVVESSVTKADQEIDGEPVKKGTWLMTVEVANDDVWKAIEKGEITGLSMGGVGHYSTEDVQLEKSAPASAPADDVPEKLNLLERVAKALGIESAVVKGEMRDRYEKRVRSEKFWTAFSTLQSILQRWDYWTDETVYETDEDKVREALNEFNEIIVEILQDSGTITKELHDGHPAEEAATDAGQPVEKAGKKMSKANKEKLNSICQQLSEFVKEFDDEPEDEEKDEDQNDTDADGTGKKNEEQEEIDMTKDDVQKMIDESVKKALAPAEPQQQAEQPVEKAEETLTAEAVQKMISEAIEKAMKPVEKAEEPAEQPAAESAMSAENVSKMINDAIAKAFKQRGIATALDDGGDQAVEKAEEQHYLHGLL